MSQARKIFGARKCSKKRGGHEHKHVAIFQVEANPKECRSDVTTSHPFLGATNNKSSRCPCSRVSQSIFQSSSLLARNNMSRFAKILVALAAVLITTEAFSSTAFLGSRLVQQQRASSCNALSMKVVDIDSEAAFDKTIANAGGALVVIDYSTTWCGPCKVIAPKFDEFSEKYPDAVFLKVCCVLSYCCNNKGLQWNLKDYNKREMHVILRVEQNGKICVIHTRKIPKRYRKDTVTSTLLAALPGMKS